LEPCPSCHSRGFIFSSLKGFTCSTCHPEEDGQRVWAAGPDRDQQNDSPLRPPEPKRSGSLYKNFLAGLPWISSNIERLIQVGWRRHEIFRRAKTSYPLGRWGLAWLGPWEKEGLLTEIHQDGRVVFTYRNNGRLVKQSCFPEIYLNINMLSTFTGK
jgi:hypothetical protein